MTGATAATATSPARVVPESPFVGLEPYGEEDAEFFFGRERDLRIIAANLRGARLTLLYGPSGVGKSSVLLAGVVHRLRPRPDAVAGTPGGHSGGAWDAGTRVALTYFSAWRDEGPLERLMEAMHASVAGRESSNAWEPGSPVLDSLHAWTAGGRTLLVILDQFEEYFLYHSEDSRAETFAATLPTIISDSSLRVNFLISIREDAWARLDRFKGSIPTLFANYLRLDYIDTAAGREAIERPIDAYNERLDPGTEPFSIEPALVDAVLGGVATRQDIARAEESGDVDARTPDRTDDKIETPFLQLVMERLWEATLAEGAHRLRVETLERLGGPEQIVRGHLEHVMSALGVEERDIAASAFRFLVTPGKTKIAHRSSDLAFWTGSSEAAMTKVLERLAAGRRGRILRPLPPPLGETGTRYEIFHDVLAEAILGWRDRYEQTRESEAKARQLEEAAREERARHSAQLRRRSAVIAALCALGLVVGLVAYVFGNQKATSQSRALAATAVDQLDEDPELSVLLAREAWDKDDTPQAEEALRRAVRASRIRVRIPGVDPRYPLALPVRDTVLVKGPREVRGWGALGQPLRMRLRPGGYVNEVAVSRDGRTVAAGGDTGVLVRRLGKAGEDIRLANGKDIRSLEISPDGRFVATGDLSETSVWDAKTGRRLANEAMLVDALEFHPRDPGRLASATCGDSTARLWSWRTEKPRELRKAGDANTHPTGGEGDCEVAFSPNGRWLATTILADDARLWSSRSGRFLERLDSYPKALELAWRPDSRSLAVASEDNTYVYESPRGGSPPSGPADQVDFRAPAGTLTGHAGDVQSVAFSPDGRRIVTGGTDGSLRVWDAEGGFTLIVLRGHSSSVDDVAFLQGNDRVMSTSNDGTVRVWDARVDQLRGHTGEVVHAAYGPDGRRAATVERNGRVRLWTLRDGRSVRIDTANRLRRASSVEFDRRGDRIVVSGESPEGNQRALIVSVRGARPLASEDGGAGELTEAEFSPDGKQLLILPGTGEPPALWKPGERKRDVALPPLPRDVAASAASFSPDGRLIVVAGNDGVARIIDARAPKPKKLRELKGHQGYLYGTTFSRDGERLLTYGADRVPRVWDVDTGEPLASLRGHSEPIFDADFSPDGHQVVTGSVGGTIRIWDASDGRAIAEETQERTIRSISFNRDGRSVLAATGFTARISQCDACGSIKRVVDLANRRVTRRLSEAERRDFLGEG